MTPYDALEGTVWIHNPTNALYVVLNDYSNDVPGQHSMWTFRRCINLETGEDDWFMSDSWFTRESTRFA